jgi:uncharacterized protein (DUF2141 family)
MRAAGEGMRMTLTIRLICKAAAAAIIAQGAVVWAADGPLDGVDQNTCREFPYSILVHLKNVRDDKGTITIDLHGDDPEKFLKSGAKLLRMRVPAVAGDMDICVPVDKPGIYAFALYQDRDSNLKLDKTWIGLPAEPFGVSRDAPIRMAPPKHKDAAFDVSGPLTPVTVTLRK